MAGLSLPFSYCLSRKSLLMSLPIIVKAGGPLQAMPVTKAFMVEAVTLCSFIPEPLPIKA